MNLKLARSLQILAVALLLAFAWLGISGGFEQWPQSQSLGQKVQTFSQCAYGILALAVAASAAWRQRVVRAVRIAWLVALTIAGGLAPVVWGDAGWTIAGVAALAALLVGLLILWLLNLDDRGLTRA